ncbi:hypothetical protein DID80_02690 [Candidatus Marinamargulisbacteria bacterium SCGC AAA071-K20]|nr:hypothetical protein DID80_02690 [Candidatus Marinamargulisbacteria bacterium SCGC AAA071-K20]
MVSYSTERFLDYTKTNISLHKWSSTGTPKKVMLICHGIAEHGARYAPFAQFLAKQNILVYAIDHRGHGLTSKETGFGVVGETDSYLSLVRNINEAKKYILENNPSIEFVMLGHSMGSFLAQAAVQDDPIHVKGLILSGTSIEPALLLNFGKAASRFLGSLLGMTRPSLIIKIMAFAPYILPFIPFRSKGDWICSVDQVVDDFMADPLCNSRPSYQYFYALFDVLNTIYREERLKMIPKDLPLLLFSGEKDPLAKGTSALKKIVKKYKDTGHQNIQLKIYPKGRHEMLLEYNKEEVFLDVATWLGSL